MEMTSTLSGSGHDPAFLVFFLQVKVLRELCRSLSIAETARMAKVDLIRKLKDHLGIPSEFVKVFTKFLGAQV